MSFFLKLKSQKAKEALERDFAAAVARENVFALEKIGDGIIADIRTKDHFHGTLEKGLWKKVKARKSSARLDMGWSGVGAAFGPGHEFGFKKKKWFVKPVNVRTSTEQTDKRLGKPILALRFVVGGQVVYSRGHEVSAPKKLHPHFKPAADRYPIQETIDLAIVKAKQRVGL